MRFKATAGLHHALRRPPRHGFLNLLAAARAGLFTAYGSCSFFEPVEDLIALGVLPPGPGPGRQ